MGDSSLESQVELTVFQKIPTMNNSTTQPADDLSAKFDELSDLLDKQPEERPTEDRTDPNPQNTLQANLAPDHFLCAKSPEELLVVAKQHRANATEFFKNNNLQKAADQYELAIKKLIVAKMHDDYVWKNKSGPVVDDLTMSDYEQNRITNLPELLLELTPEQSSTLTEIYTQLATIHNNLALCFYKKIDKKQENTIEKSTLNTFYQIIIKNTTRTIEILDLLPGGNNAHAGVLEKAFFRRATVNLKDGRLDDALWDAKKSKNEKLIKTAEFTMKKYEKEMQKNMQKMFSR